MMLASISTALFMVFVITIVFSLFPLRLLDPAWQLKVISTLTNNAPISVVAFVLLTLAMWMNPTTGLKSYTRRIRRLALLAVVGFLLLIPLQFAAIRQQYSNQDRQNTSQLNKAMETITRLRQTVEKAQNTEMLQRGLQSLSDPTSLQPADLAKPFPVLKQELFARIDQAEAAAKRRFRIADPMTPWLLVRRSLQTSLLSLCYAFAYAAGALRRNSKLTLLLDLKNGLKQLPNSINRYFNKKKGRRKSRSH
jgi:hypothetical protein